MRNNRYLFVTDRSGAIIGRLRDNYGISGCTVVNKQNDNSTLAFEIQAWLLKYPLV